ncbi:MAG: hypothetical protein ACREB9_03315 [Thermoplasmata archaeon]
MSTETSDLGPVVIAILVVSFVFVRRIIATQRGARISEVRFVIYSAFVVAIFGLTILTGALVLPIWEIPVDLAVLAAFVGVGAIYVGRRVRIVEQAPGEWVYLLGPLVPILYLALFLTRLSLDFIVLNVSPFTFTLTSSGLTPFAAATLAIVDLLFAVSTGLVVGRTIGVYRAYRAARAQAEARSAPLSP